VMDIGSGQMALDPAELQHAMDSLVEVP
jgi:hypothetical protein